MNFRSNKNSLSMFKNSNKKSMLMLIPVSFLIMILMTSVMLNEYFVNNRNFVNVYAAVDNKTAPSTSALEGPDSANITNTEIIMKQLLSSNKPDDIATLAYTWGYPLVTAEVAKDYKTNPNVPQGPGFGPINQFHPTKDLANASFKDFVRPNVDTMYDQAWLDLKNGPLGTYNP
ncbi:MAG: DUF1254 domain-containing protein [Candidatus Nitrosopolaris sp.]